MRFKADAGGSNTGLFKEVKLTVPAPRRWRRKTSDVLLLPAPFSIS
jgi:hypothetical protein